MQHTLSDQYALPVVMFHSGRNWTQTKQRRNNKMKTLKTQIRVVTKHEDSSRECRIESTSSSHKKEFERKEGCSHLGH